MSAKSSKQTWLVQSSSGDLGPFNLQQLQQLASRGSLNRSSLLREVRSTSWIRADQIPSIFDTGLVATTSAARREPASSRSTGSNHETVARELPRQPPSMPKVPRAEVNESKVSTGLLVGAASMIAYGGVFCGRDVLYVHGE